MSDAERKDLREPSKAPASPGAAAHTEVLPSAPSPEARQPRGTEVLRSEPFVAAPVRASGGPPSRGTQVFQLAGRIPADAWNGSGLENQSRKTELQPC